MRVLYWNELFRTSIGGGQVIDSVLLPALRARGHDLEVITSRGDAELPDEDEWDGFPIHRFGFREVLASRDVDRLAATLARVAAVKRAFRPDLVHLNLSDVSGFFHLRTERDRSRPTLLSVIVAPPVRVATATSVLGRLLGGAAWVTAVSEAIRGDVVEACPATAGRSSVVHPGFDPPAATPPPLPAGTPSILCAGRLVRDKGVDVAVDALATVVETLPATRLTVVGDGPEREALAAQASGLGLGDRVRFTGIVGPQAMPGLIGDCHVVAVPSRWREAFGLVALEAAQAGRPVVASAVGGLPEVVAAGVTGLLVARDDPAALAAALVELLSDRERAVRMGRAGRARAVERFSLDAHADAFDALYRRLAA